MAIEQEIEYLRDELRSIAECLNSGLDEIHAMFLSKAMHDCPFHVGDIVEFEPGHMGRVERIGYHVDAMHELDANAEVLWTLSGQKAKEDGFFGRREFHDIGPATHDINGNQFRLKPGERRLAERRSRHSHHLAGARAHIHH